MAQSNPSPNTGSLPVYSLEQITSRLGGRILGNPEVQVKGIATLANASPSDLSFLSNSKYRKQLDTTNAGALIVGVQDQDATGLPRIVCDNPYVYFAKALTMFYPKTQEEPGIHPSAVVGEGCDISGSSSIAANAVIGKGVTIGEKTVIGPGCVIASGVKIGSDCTLYPNVTIYHDCRLGDRVILHAGAVIGSDGFGLANENGSWLKIPQVGSVVIGNDVEIGSNTTVDRGALEDTIIEDGVKLDNLIQIAHNVRIGAHTAMAACVGVAGSAKIGRHCTVGGAAVILGHLEIADHVNISAGTFITKSIAEPGTYTSVLPFMPHREWLKAGAHIRHLDDYSHTIRKLEERIQELERKKP
jgi:UDP-3-O-[3-hydroxymyristoyl] glucosamine N-acyltransferase